MTDPSDVLALTTALVVSVGTATASARTGIAVTRTVRVTRTGTQVTGRLVTLTLDAAGRRRATIEYPGPGGTTHTTLLPMQESPFEPGARLEVRYDPQRPHEPTVPGAGRRGTRWLAWRAAFVGAAAVLATALVLTGWTTDDLRLAYAGWGYTLCGVAGVLTLASTERPWRELALRRNGVRTSGKVVRTVPARGTIAGRPIIAFTAPDHRRIEIVGLGLDYRKPGDEVELTYDPANPYRATARPKGDLVSAVWTHLALGALVSLPAGYGVYLAVRAA